MKRRVVFSTKHVAEFDEPSIPDIDRDEEFYATFKKVQPYTMVSKEALYSLYNATKYIFERNIPGDIVECGVWRGGSSLLAALALRDLERGAASKGGPATERTSWLYDTFEGMTEPTDVDLDLEGHSARTYIDTYGDDGKWAYAAEDEVRAVFHENGVDEQKIKIVRGDVLNTLKESTPDKISILRLDTDWYESTKMELEILYPKLSVGGVLIIDDYGHWAGSRKAVDEYFSHVPAPLLHRTNYAVRVAIKI